MIRYLFILIAITTVLNGIGFWLNLVGWTNSNTHQSLIMKKQSFYDYGMFHFNNPDLLSEEAETKHKEEYNKYKLELFAHLYGTQPKQLLVKLPKYLVSVFILLSLIYFSIKSNKAFHKKSALYALLWLCLLIAATVYSFYKYDWQSVVSGFNLYLIFFVAWLSHGNLMRSDLEFLSKCLFCTLGILALMAPIELTRGLELFNTQSLLKIRMSGFMIQPNSFGIYVLCIYSIFMAYYHTELNKYLFVLFSLGTLSLIILSGSNTAGVVFFAAIFFYLLEKHTKTVKNIVFSLFYLIVIAISLYLFEGRDALISLFGRFEKYEYYFSHHDLSVLDYLIGQGIGIGTNTLLQIQNLFPFKAFADIPIKFSTDSTPLLLMIQVGLVGCLLFYGFLIKAMIRDRQQRLAYLVFMLCSMTINIIEVFPLNILLGLMLARSFNETAPKLATPKPIIIH